MDVRWICTLTALSAMAVGCSEAGNYLPYSSLDRLPGTHKPVEDWIPAKEAPQQNATAIAPGAGEEKSVGESKAQDAGKPDLPKPEDPAEQTDGSDSAVNSAETTTPNSNEATTDDVTSEPREIKLLVREKRFRREGDDLLRVSYDDIDLLKVLNMEPVPHNAVEYFPDWLNELDGKRIRIRGFMYPHFLATGIRRFALARDNGICCFVKEPRIYDVFEVSLAENEVTDYIQGKPFDVEGTFRIDPDADETELFQLYRIEDAKVLR